MSDETLDMFAGVGGVAGRDRALAALETHRAEVVKALQDAAVARWRITQRPVTVNDIRQVLRDLQYEGDPRILGAAFPRSKWVAVGWETVQGSAANARPVRQFVPRPEVR